LSAEDLSKILRVSKQTIYKEIRNGKFGKPIKFGREYRIPKIFVVEKFFVEDSADTANSADTVETTYTTTGYSTDNTATNT
jgi:excisionase family DNA binding protein